MRDYFENLFKAPKDAWSLFNGIVTVFGVLAFVGYEPKLSPLNFILHGWRDASTTLWRAALHPLSVVPPVYLAQALTIILLIIFLCIRAWHSGHQFYGRRLLLTYWPSSEEFERRDKYTIFAVWLILIIEIGVLSLVFEVKFGAAENIPRDFGHDVIRATVGFTVLILCCFPRALGGALLAALALIGCDAIIPVIVHALAQQSSAP